MRPWLVATSILLLAGCEGPAEPPGEASTNSPVRSEAPPAGPRDEEPDPREPEPGEVVYDLLPDEGLLYVIVRKDESTIGSGLSHDHAVRATGWSGRVVYVAGDPGRSTVEIEIPVSGLEPDGDEVREAAGLSGTISSGDRKRIGRSLRAEDQLDAESHPTIRFESTSVVRDGEGWVVEGELTIRGETKSIEAEIEVEIDGDRLEARGRFEATHADFGFEPYSAFFGALRNAEPIEFVLDLRGRARE